jgi:hypothetical protein
MTRRDVVIARRDELLTVKEYAIIARVHQQTVYRRIWSDSQPGAVRLGGQWRIDLSAQAKSSQSC